MPDTHDDLWGQVLWRAAQSESSVFDLLCEAEVGYFQVAVSCDQQVLWLEVSVGDFLLVQVLESEHDFCYIKERDIVGKQVLFTQQAEYLTALNILKGQVHMCLVLKALVPRITSLSEYLHGFEKFPCLHTTIK